MHSYGLQDLNWIGLRTIYQIVSSWLTIIFQYLFRSTIIKLRRSTRIYIGTSFLCHIRKRHAECFEFFLNIDVC